VSGWLPWGKATSGSADLQKRTIDGRLFLPGFRLQPPNSHDKVRYVARFRSESSLARTMRELWASELFNHSQLKI
jgi:hypothetical protein